VVKRGAAGMKEFQISSGVSLERKELGWKTSRMEEKSGLVKSRQEDDRREAPKLLGNGW
jgi:hypothetical protein